MKKKFSIKVLLLFSFLLCTSCSDSSENDKKIDALIKKSHEGMVNLQYLETIKYGKEAENLTLKTNNSEKLPYIYLELADGLAGLELQKESLTYLDKILKMDFDKKDKIFKARVYEIQAYNYNELGLGAQYLENNRKVIRLLHDAKNEDEAYFLSKSYNHLGFYYYSLQNVDSSFYYYKKQEDVFKKFPDEDNVIDIAGLYNIKGYLHLQYTKHKDSALFYFQKSYDFKKAKHLSNVTREYLGFGDYYFLENDYNKALDYYKKAQQNAKIQSTQFDNHNDINKVLADTYENLRDQKNQNFYLKKYTQFNDSLKIAHKKSVDDAVNIMMQKKAEENFDTKKNYTLLLSVISAAILIIGIFLFQYFKKKKLETKKTEILLTEKEDENQDLKRKVNQSFEEVVQLAKDNNPEFLTRFQEVYPDFDKKLLAINPNLVTSELRFCAMLFLNFSTKDIAEYTFISPKTVQNRKNSIRKRLDISSEEDLYVWFKNLL